MESRKRGRHTPLISPLRLHEVLPLYDVRTLIWKLLNENDREMIRCAQNQNRVPTLRRRFVIRAGEAGHLNLFKWMHERRLRVFEDKPFHFRGATSHSQLHILEWALATIPRMGSWDTLVKWRFLAARDGQLPTLDWAEERMRHHTRTLRAEEERIADVGYMTAAAAGNGHIHILERLAVAQNPVPPKHHHMICCEAAKGGHLATLKWLYARGMLWREELYAVAIAKRKYDVVAWAVAAAAGEIPITAYTPNKLAERDDMEGLLWLRETYHPPMGDSILCKAALTGRLETLRWLFERDFVPWINNKIAQYAAMGGHKNILEWMLIERGMEVTSPPIYVCALIKDDRALFHWLREITGIPVDPRAVYETCIWNQDMNRLLWLHREEGIPLHSIVTLGAAQQGHVDFLRDAVEYGVPWDLEACVDASADGHRAVVEFCLEMQRQGKSPRWDLNECIRVAATPELAQWLAEIKNTSAPE